MSDSPWAAFFPGNVSKNPAHFVGPNVAGVIVQAIETGIIINQSIKFWSNASSEHIYVKAIVAFVSIVAGFQMMIAFYNTWIVIVLGFGNWSSLVNLRWPDRIQPTLNCLMAAPVQSFLIWRCWTAMQRKLIILIPLIVLLIASIVANIAITIHLFGFSVVDIILSRTPPRAYITAFVLTAALDVCITSLMLWFLLRVKSQVVSRRLDKIIGRLMTIVWESAFPPCACAIAACVVYITMSLENLWDVFCQSILGKLYVISLFVILNGRADLKECTCGSNNAHTSSGLTRYYISAAEGRVNLTSVLEHDQIDEGLTPTSEQFVLEQQRTPHTTGNGWGKDGNSDVVSIMHTEATLSGYMRERKVEPHTIQ